MKGDSEANMGTFVSEILATPKKNKGKEKVPKLRKKLPKQIHFHSHLQSQVETCIPQFFLWTTKKKERREKTCPRVSRGGQVSQDTKGGKSKSGGQNIERILALPWCLLNNFGATKVVLQRSSICWKLHLVGFKSFWYNYRKHSFGCLQSRFPLQWRQVESLCQSWF